MTHAKNSLDCVVDAVKFETAERIPVIPQIFGHTALVTRNPFHDYLTKGDILAKSQLGALKYYGNDAAFAIMDVNVETEALGSELEYRPNLYPFVKNYILKKEKDQINLDELAIPDPQSAGRMPEILKAQNILKKQLGNDVLLVGCTLGPFTLSCQLLGLENTLYLALDLPKEFNRLLDFSEKVIISYGIAQIESGAHLPLIFEPSGSPAVITRAFFEQYIESRITHILSEFKKAGAIANWLHIAGPTQTILSIYPEMGVNIGNFDYCVSAEEVKTLVPTMCVDGNINSLNFIDQDPIMILKESKKLMKDFSKRGGFILSSGCEIPPESNPTLIKEMIQAAHQMK